MAGYGDDAIDRMIENAKRMRRKPFQREQLPPDRPQPAQADDARVAPRRRGIAAYIDQRMSPVPLVDSRLADDLATADRNLRRYRGR